ncbi:MAG: GNAT family N-acetyltransferase [Pirellulales bacterium]
MTVKNVAAAATPTFRIRCANSGDRIAIAALIRESTNSWYQARGNPPIFAGEADATLLFPDVYAALDGECCLLAEDDGLLGSCFYHPRSTHVGLGIMNVAPTAFGRGVASALLDRIIAIAEDLGLPVRLVSSAGNLDSYSLYTRRGFVPRALFQDMILPVPADGISSYEPPADVVLRPAEPSDVEAIAALELELCGIERTNDHRYFLANPSQGWQTSVAIDADGRVVGSLASIDHPGSRMLGPGMMRDDETALALILYALNRRKSWSPVFLVPADRSGLVGELYRRGGRNLELHLLQTRGACPTLRGVTMPTFMPETG